MPLDKKTQKGLCITTGPYLVLQMLWYCTCVEPDTEWDMLLIDYGNSRSSQLELAEACKRSGVFERVLTDDRQVSREGRAKLIGRFFGMLGYWITGRRKAFCRRHLNEVVGDIDAYDRILVSCDHCLDCSCAMALSGDGRVAVMEEGMNDYLPRRRMPAADPMSIAGFLIAKMGYMNYYDHRTTKFYFPSNRRCIKYNSIPEKLEFRDYREIRPLFAKSTEAREQAYRDACEKVFFRSEPVSALDDIDVVLFSGCFYDFVTNNADDGDLKDIYERLRGYLKKTYPGKRILIKKHPKDEFEYDCWDDMDVKVMYRNVPAEALLPYLREKSIVVTNTSSLLLTCVSCGYEFSVIRINQQSQEFLRKNSSYLLERFGLEDSVIDI